MEAMKPISVPTALLLSALASGVAAAQVRKTGYKLPLALALDAATAAVAACEAAGYKVSVAVVDPSGETRAFVKGDHATVHTRETSFRKAYTTVTLGPIFGFDALGSFVEKTRTSPVSASFLTVPNIILLPGAVAIRAKGEIIGAVGVGGAPGGEKDEACAAAGVAAIKARLPTAN
jgi:uncharacterized protein GlcG (DUF336 family)